MIAVPSLVWTDKEKPFAKNPEAQSREVVSEHQRELFWVFLEREGCAWIRNNWLNNGREKEREFSGFFSHSLVDGWGCIALLHVYIFLTFQNSETNALFWAKNASQTHTQHVYNILKLLALIRDLWDRCSCLRQRWVPRPLLLPLLPSVLPQWSLQPLWFQSQLLLRS